MTSSFAFFLKISELFSKPENSNYGRRGDPKRMRACHIYNPKLIFNVDFDPLAVKIRKFCNNHSLAFFLKISEMFSKHENSNYSRNGSRKRMYKKNK